MGARNVIYGTTSASETEQKMPSGEMYNPKLPNEEQYRYMLTNINDVNDWTHEREWRWINHRNLSKGDYLPIWKNNEFDEDFEGDIFFYFESGIIILVRYESEIDELERLFSTYTDEKIYNIPNITRTFAVSIEILAQNNLLTYDTLDYISLIRNGICRRLKKK